MQHGLLLIALAPALAYGARDCVAPPAALFKLKAYLSYESSINTGSHGERQFSFVLADDEALFLQHEVPPNFDATKRLVYVFREGRPLLGTSCPANSGWIQCAQSQFENFARHPDANAPVLPATRSCDLRITIPKWRPSPNDAYKKGSHRRCFKNF